MRLPWETVAGAHFLYGERIWYNQMNMEQNKQKIIVGVVLLVLVVLVGYLFVANQVATAKFNASKTALMSQVASLNVEDQNLGTNLLLLAAPLGLTSPAAPMLVSTKGMLSGGGKNAYVITTQYGVKASVKNSADNTVDAALQPLVGQMIQFAGTFIPGTPAITLTNVNGVSIP